MSTPDTRSFPNLLDQIAALHGADPAEIRAGHLDLAPGLWLSTDPAGQGRLACAPAPEGFRLTLEQGDSGRWAALGMYLPRDKLESARYFGLLVRASTDTVFACTPTLRYNLEQGGFEDSPTRPMVLSGATR